VAVTGIPTGEWVVVAEPSKDGELSVVEANRLRREVRRVTVASAGVTPDDVILAKRGALPFTASGKIQRAQVKSRLLRGDLS
jgi:acyl-CoA synthetase (AMP-forming)/AMP-acid ligase II